MTTFAQATSVDQLSPHEYLAHFPDDWSIGSVPHGGFVTSCFMKVASTHFRTTLASQNQPHTIALQLDFLRRTQAGPALFTVHDTKVGRQTSIIHVTLAQPKSTDAKPPFDSLDLREEVVGYITNSNMENETGLTFHTGFSLSLPPPPVDLSKLRQDQDENWAFQGAMPFDAFRKATQKIDFYFPRRGQVIRSTADEWVCFSNGEKFTNESLGFIADMWPMPVEQFLAEKNLYDVATYPQSIDTKPARHWFPTLLLNLDVKKSLPKDGAQWLFARVSAKQIRRGRMDLEVIVLDEAGDIVALSHHVCLILGAERNLAARSQSASKI